MLVNCLLGYSRRDCTSTHGELVLGVGDLGDLRPGEADLGTELVLDVVEVDAEGVNAEEDLGALAVHHGEVGDAVHLQVLGDLEVLQHGLAAGQTAVLPVELADLFHEKIKLRKVP